MTETPNPEPATRASEGPSQQPAYSYAYAAGREPLQTDRNWASASHWGTLVAAWLAMGFMAPLVIMLTVGNQSPYVRRHAVESLNFQISLLIYGAAAILFSIVTIGLGLIVVIPLGLVAVVVRPGVPDPGVDQGGQRRGLPLPADAALRQLRPTRFRAAGRAPRRRRAAGPSVVSTSRSPTRSSRPRADEVVDRGASGGVQDLDGKAVVQPQLEQHPLDPPGLGVEHLARVRRADAAS